MATSSSSSMSPLCRVLRPRFQKPCSLTRSKEKLDFARRLALRSFSLGSCFQSLRDTALLRDSCAESFSCSACGLVFYDAPKPVTHLSSALFKLVADGAFFCPSVDVVRFSFPTPRPALFVALYGNTPHRAETLTINLSRSLERTKNRVLYGSQILI
jgi:hypothetical protein